MQGFSHHIYAHSLDHLHIFRQRNIYGSPLTCELLILSAVQSLTTADPQELRLAGAWYNTDLRAQIFGQALVCRSQLTTRL